MYNAIELKELTIKPKINDITLDVLREYYEIFLHPFIYTYTITKNDKTRMIALRFNTHNFCHLLGVETIAKRAVNYDKSKVMPPTNINCELLFYSKYDNAVIHLGLEKDSEEEYYIPRTFFVEKLETVEDKDIYIDNQEQITVKKENRIIML